jgi:SAM-dependent methyltransferase
VLLYWHSLGNKALTWMTNILNDLNLTDMETCYKAVRADVLKNLRLRSERFGIEPEITTRLAQWGARIYEIPISYHGRTYLEGKNIGWKDGVQAIWLLLKFRFFDTRFSERVGHSILESLAESPSIAAWTLGQFKHALGSRVLEAGFGTGNLTRLLLDRQRLVAVDNDPFYVDQIDQKLGHLENVTFIKADLEDEALYAKLEDERFDTVVCVNVIEHLDQPLRALKGFRSVLRQGGRAVILVPAHQFLFSETDRALEHRRRYEVGNLRELLKQAGFTLESITEFNRLGVAGWFFNKLTGRVTIARWQARLFGILLPIGRMLETLKFLPGLSLIAIVRRP